MEWRDDPEGGGEGEGEQQHSRAGARERKGTTRATRRDRKRQEEEAGRRGGRGKRKKKQREERGHDDNEGDRGRRRRDEEGTDDRHPRALAPHQPGHSPRTGTERGGNVPPWAFPKKCAAARWQQGGGRRRRRKGRKSLQQKCGCPASREANGADWETGKCACKVSPCVPMAQVQFCAASYTRAARRWPRTASRRACFMASAAAGPRRRRPCRHRQWAL